MSASTGADGPRRGRHGDPRLPDDSFSDRPSADRPGTDRTILADRAEQAHRPGRPDTGGADARGGSGLAAKAGPALLALGIGWVLFGLAIPMTGLTTGTSISYLLAILLLLSAVSELAAAMSAGRDWKPTHALLAVLFVAGGIVTLVWPAPTLTVVARIVAWYLLVKGVHDIATAFAQRRAGRAGEAFGTDAGHLRGGAPWWIPLAVGAFSIGIAFWAAGHHYPTFSFVLTWVALAALVTGLTKIAAAFRSGAEELRSQETSGVDELTQSGFGGRATAEATRSQARGDTRVESRPDGGTQPPRA